MFDVYMSCQFTRITLFPFRVRAVKPATVSIAQIDRAQDAESHSHMTRAGEGAKQQHEQSLSTSILLSKPILALEFSCMEMQVQAPTVVSQYFKQSLRTP